MPASLKNVKCQISNLKCQMRSRYWILVVLIGLLGYLFIGLFPNPAQALHFVPIGSNNVSVGATVGSGLTLSVSGYIAPYASVVLSSNGVVLRSTTADAAGNFSLSQVLITDGFTSFCLDSVDFKRLGESESCFTVPPATSSIVKTDIFLPPTLGVFRTEVNAGSKALVFGYGMPGATINVHLNDSLGCSVSADSTGYYECNLDIPKAGSYSAYADSVLKGKQSEPQLKRVLIQGLSLTEQIKKQAQTTTNNFWNLLTHLPGGFFIWLVLLLIILIIILLVRIFKPEWFPKITAPNPLVVYHSAWDSLFHERKLHHWWMEGVGF